MVIAEMHYDFKKKINKVDSQQYRNLRIPEIDWALREAEELFVKMIAEPRIRSQLGFELDQRSIDDIRNIVTDSTSLTISNNIAAFPEDYWHYLKGEVIISKNNCENKKAELKIRQHDDNFEKSPFDNSSFEWRVVNGLVFSGGIKLFSDNTFIINEASISYIRRLKIMHFASGYTNGTYNLPDGTVLTGTQDCELASQTHSEIVDIAVLIVTGEIQAPDYQIKLNKLSFNNLK